MNHYEADVINAVLYAMRQGCFFPVPEPKPPYSVKQLRQWGAMRNLHDAVAKLDRHVSGWPSAVISEPPRPEEEERVEAGAIVIGQKGDGLR
jgi:hypothetical protein